MYLSSRVCNIKKLEILKLNFSSKWRLREPSGGSILAVYTHCQKITRVHTLKTSIYSAPCPKRLEVTRGDVLLIVSHVFGEWSPSTRKSPLCGINWNLPSCNRTALFPHSKESEYFQYVKFNKHLKWLNVHYKIPNKIKIRSADWEKNEARYQCFVVNFSVVSRSQRFAMIQEECQVVTQRTIHIHSLERQFTRRFFRNRQTLLKAVFRYKVIMLFQTFLNLSPSQEHKTKLADRCISKACRALVTNPPWISAEAGNGWILRAVTARMWK